MSVRQQAARLACAVLRHRPVPLAPVRHIGIQGGPQIVERMRGKVCSRCGIRIEEK